MSRVRNNWWNHPPEDIDPNYDPGETLVEQAHIDTRKQILSFRQAGIRLAEYRKEQYDFEREPDIETVRMDPTREPDFDLADASELLEQLDTRFDSVKDAQSNAAKAEQEALAEKKFQERLKKALEDKETETA